MGGFLDYTQNRFLFVSSTLEYTWRSQFRENEIVMYLASGRCFRDDLLMVPGSNVETDDYDNTTSSFTCEQYLDSLPD